MDMCGLFQYNDNFDFFFTNVIGTSYDEFYVIKEQNEDKPHAQMWKPLYLSLHQNNMLLKKLWSRTLYIFKVTRIVILLTLCSYPYSDVILKGQTYLKWYICIADSWKSFSVSKYKRINSCYCHGLKCYEWYYSFIKRTAQKYTLCQ